MKTLSLFLATLISGSLAFSAESKTSKKKLKYIQEVMNLATADEKKDLVKILDGIEVTPLKQKFKGQSVFRVRFVEKGSVFDRAGIERGDIVTNGLPQNIEAEKKETAVQ